VGLAERQVHEADRFLEVARDRVGEIGWRLDRTILEPARIALALGVGVRKGIEAIFMGRRAGIEHEPDADGRHSDTDGRHS